MPLTVTAICAICGRQALPVGAPWQTTPTRIGAGGDRCPDRRRRSSARPAGSARPGAVGQDERRRRRASVGIGAGQADRLGRAPRRWRPARPARREDVTTDGSDRDRCRSRSRRRRAGQERPDRDRLAGLDRADVDLDLDGGRIQLDRLDLAAVDVDRHERPPAAAARRSPSGSIRTRRQGAVDASQQALRAAGGDLAARWCAACRSPGRPARRRCRRSTRTCRFVEPVERDRDARGVEREDGHALAQRARPRPAATAAAAAWSMS